MVLNRRLCDLLVDQGPQFCRLETPGLPLLLGNVRISGEETTFNPVGKSQIENLEGRSQASNEG